MSDEYNVLIKNDTSTLVHQPKDANIVHSIWLFHHKYLADGTLSRYKARLVANGSTQVEGIDVDGTFSPVRKYVVEILERAHIVNCNPSRTPVDTEYKLGDDGDLSSKRQPTLSRLSAEAEYHGVTNAVAETCWLRNLLHLVVVGHVRVLHVPSRYQYADIFTKGLPSVLFEDFRTSLSVRCPPAQTAKEC
ncbi:ribonuclease H-like domain-containing protein [Tanacetum coccineum]